MAFSVLAPAAVAATLGSGPGAPVSLAAMLAAPKTFTDSYSCDLSAYGTGIKPVTVSATLEFPPVAQAQQPFSLTLKTASVTLPSSVLSQLTGVVSFDLASSLKASQYGTAGSAALSGTASAPSTLTGLPAATATGTVSIESNVTGFPTGGTGVITVPAPHLTFTPWTSAKALSAISCTTADAKKSISVAVAPHVFGTKGPLYKCVASGSAMGTVLLHVPTTITMSGSRTTGKTDTVTLNAAGIGPKGAPDVVKSFSFAADLTVKGAQQGKIALKETTKDLTSPNVKVSGKLKLTKAGTDQILVPAKFTESLNLPSGFQPITLTCTLTTHPVPVGLVIKVNKTEPHPQPTPSPTSTNGGQPQGTGQPTGAPDTGGGTGSAAGADLAMGAGGLAMVVTGGGLVVIGRRRRAGRPGRLG